MKRRNLNAKKEKWKYYHIFTSTQVFEKVFCCTIDRTIWYNGKDGYFYNYMRIKSKNNTSKEEVIVSYRTLEFVTNNMRTGYNMNGDPVCHRKNYYGSRQPLRGARIIPKSRNSKKQTGIERRGQR